MQLILSISRYSRSGVNQLYLCKGINCGVLSNEHVGELSKHVVLQCKEGLVLDAKSRHEHDHLPVEMQSTCTVNQSFHCDLSTQVF